MIQRNLYTQTAQKTHTHRKFCTQKLYPEQLLQSKICFRTKTLTDSFFVYAQQFYRQTVFTQKVLRTEVLRTEDFTHNIFYIQTLLYTDAFTLKTNCTQKLVRIAHFYTQPAFTQRGFAPPS